MNKKISFLLLAFLFLLISGLSANTSLGAKGGEDEDGGDNDAPSSQYLFGWAWGGTSEGVTAANPDPTAGVGWIKFNSCNDDRPHDGLPDGGCNPASGNGYGVKVDPESGNMSGYAWSNNVGWISFNRSDAGSPPSDDPGSGVLAKFNMSKGNFAGTVKGWARVLSAMDDTTDGWDGWIHLSDTSSSRSFHPSGYDDGSKGVTYNKTAGTVVGYAWGSSVVGWIKFLNVTYGANTGPFDYTLSNSGNIQVVQGGSGQVSITRNFVSGTSVPVTLSITSPAITGVTPVISTNPCTPICSSKITFNVGENVSAQTYNIVVKGSPDGPNGDIRQTSFNLTVTEPVTNNLNISCLVEGNPPYFINQPVTWQAVVSGTTLGTPPYTAEWAFTSENEVPFSSNGHSDPSSSPIEIEKTYSKIGIKTATATVTDSTGTLSGTCTTAAEVNVVVKTNVIQK